ncbi:putative multidrug export ATP-binding/permease protein [Lachnospiraceae bacterium]|nr:putative multidrug export ATP-binding/permease protein [Lachnospiraceae bacterium]
MAGKMAYRLKVVRSLMPYTKGVKRFFILIFISSMISMALGFAGPLFYRLFIDRVILGGCFGQMPLVAGGYLGIFFLDALLAYARKYASYALVNTTAYRVKEKIWQGFFARPFESYESEGIGDMKMRLEDDTAQIERFAGYQTIDYLISVATLLGSALLLFAIEWRLALFSAIAIPLTFWAGGALSEKERRLNDANRETRQVFSSWLHASVQGWREVRTLGIGLSQERKCLWFLHRFALFNAKWINYWTARVLALPQIKEELFQQFGLYFLGGLLIIQGRMGIGSLLVFVMYHGMLSDALETVSGTDAELWANKPFTDRLLEELGRKAQPQGEGRALPDEGNETVFEQVSFAYPGMEREVLHDFDLTIKKGERVAIMGRSGSGKTTVLKLMTGLLRPTRGRVSFGGVDLEEISLPAMHARIGFVMQENMLFNTTIRENLLYGKDGASEEEMMDACRKAYIYEFIVGLPEGLDTVIGERGVKLSGGQRQRIVLARLFLRDVEVFVLDEATSALDQYSESIVYDAIRNIPEDKTVIIVAHRESSVALCDRRVEITG